MVDVLIVIDWGTTNFRAYLLGESGQILENRTASQGVLSVSDFPKALDELLDGWHSTPYPIVMSGMVGSSKGWVEVDYVDTPVQFSSLVNALHRIDERHFIVPGVRFSREHHIDLMRGEEVQVFGAEEDGVFCLPGTHSKWVTVLGGQITNVSTYMSGELFQLLSSGSILAVKEVPQVEDNESFMWGVQKAQDAQPLSALLFTARSFMLNGALDPQHVESYLSGLLIGCELKHAVKTAEDAVYLIAEPSLARLYQDGLSVFNKQGRVLSSEAVTVRGVWRIAQAAGIV
jgi:2-dehydro-3-deoxygalactonokinase